MLVLQLGLVFIITAGLAAWTSGRSPRRRSSHGGLALTGGFGAAVLMLMAQGWLDWEQAAAFLASSLIIIIAGSIPLRGRKRLWVLSIAALVSSVLGLAFLWILPSYGRIPALPLLPEPWNRGWAAFTLISIILTSLAMLGQKSARNEGRAALAGIALTLPLAVLAYLEGAYCHGWLIAAYGASCGGYYIYNRAPALSLPGVAGGMWLAFTPGLLAALSAETIGVHIWLPALAVYGLVMARYGRANQKKA